MKLNEEILEFSTEKIELEVLKLKYENNLVLKGSRQENANFER